MQRPNQSVPPDDQATVPGAVTRTSSPSLPPPTIPVLDEGGTLAFEVEHTPTMADLVETLHDAPDAVPPATAAPAGQPWLIWTAVALLVAVGIGALLLL